MHALGLKLGLYTDAGTLTCADLPGTAGHWTLDAETFAEWGVDYVKTDGCHIAPEELHINYEAWGAALNATGRPMVYSCSWPWYLVSKGITVTVALFSCIINLLLVTRVCSYVIHTRTIELV